MPQLISAPATALIDQNNVLTLNWQPLVGPDGAFDQYDSWDITTQAGSNSPITVSFPAPAAYAGSSLLFTETLAPASYTLTMIGVANSIGSPSATNSNPWMTNNTPTPLLFPTAVTGSSVAFSAITVLLGQPLTVTLSGGYSGAAQWQVVWPDGSSTGWLPLSSNVVVKQFSNPGSGNVLIQTRYDYSSNQFNPPVTLLRQFVQQIFVVDQQAPNTSTTSGGLTGDLGIGGQQGFEIIDASSPITAVPNPWAVIARALVRDTQTQELKLLVATSRFSNASSLFGTMAADVFPIHGRPRAKELVVPPYELTSAGAETIPVKIITSTISNLIVGKSVTTALGGVFQMQTKPLTGIAPYIWSVLNLPPGVTMNVSGVINGTPLELGLFNPTFAVQDSSIPFSIDEVTLPILVETDLKVQIASGQTDALGQPIAAQGTSFGVSQVGTSVHIQMQAGNINNTATQPGGLPPYTWSTPAGALPIGLAIDPSTGLISGVPCTYNSTTDYSKTFTVTVQVTDSINAKATQTYTMTLEAAALQFGHIDQPVIFSSQDFKLVVPIFGGQSPYTFNTFQVPVSESGFYTDAYSAPAPSAVIDGQIEIPVDMPTTQTGTHSFTLGVLDSGSNSITPFLQSFSYKVETKVSQVQIVPGYVNHYWDFGDDSAATALPITGDLSGFSLSASSAVLSNGITVSIDNSVPEVDVTGPPSAFTNSQYRVPLQLTQSGNLVATISREYTLLAHNDQASPTDIGIISTICRPMIVGELVGLNPRKPYYNSPNVPALNSSFFARVQNGSVLPPGLSLDANTGLIYGTVQAAYSGNSILEYVDAVGTIHGTITINWNVVQANFQMIDNIVDSQLIGTPWTTGNTFTAPSGISLVSASVFFGVLPNGLQVGVAGSTVSLTGTPLESGYFDVWFQAVASNNQTTYFYHRIVIDYIKPLTITNTALPSISDQSYRAPNGVTLIGFGGIPPYVSWTSPQFPGGNGTGNFAGLTLTTNTDGTGTIAGQLSPAPASGPPLSYVSPTDLGTIAISLTDSRNNTPPGNGVVTSQFDLTYDNRLRITVAPTGVATIPSDGTEYSFAMSADGGVPFSGANPYQWDLATPAFSGPPLNLPAGIVFDATNSFGNTGVLSGATTVSPFSAPFQITVKDSTGATRSGSLFTGTPFTIQTGTATLTIDASGVGPIPRGESYQGTLVLDGPYVLPITWQISPTTGTPDTILTGLTLQANAGTQGATATINGTYNGTPHQTNSIANITGSGTVVTVTTNEAHGYQVSDTVVISGTTNYNLTGVVTSVTSVPALAGQNTFTVNNAATGAPENAGQISDANDLYTVRVVAVDSSTPSQVAFGLVQLNTGTNLAITTTSLPTAVVGGGYSFQLTAIDGVPSYTWKVDPFSDNAILPGLSLSNSGLITGVPTFVTSNPIPVTFRVTDNLTPQPNFVTQVLFMNAQASGLAITAPATLPQVFSGRAYSQIFTATEPGGINTPYVFSISPNTANQLPTGLTLSSGGLLSGTTTLTGFSKLVTFRVTDNIGAKVDRTYAVVVVSGLSLVSGIDFTDGTSTGWLGQAADGSVDSINPRPNLSFYVIATGVVSTAPSQMQVSIGNSNITAFVESITSGVAQIKLSGSGFPNASLGNNVLSISVTDSGVTVSATFTWTVFSENTLRLAPTSGSLPTQLLTAN